MELELNDLLNGKSTKIKSKEFLPTRAYVEPFLEKFKDIQVKFTCHAELPKQITIDDNNNNDITYNRVWVEAIMPDEYTIDNHYKSFGMVYGLDTRVPQCKFYLSSINSACTNMMVFNPTWMKIQNMESNKPLDFDLLDSIINTNYKVHDYIVALQNLLFTNTLENKENLVGSWCDRCIDMDYKIGKSKVSLSPSTAIKVYKSLFKDDKSDYYVGLDDTNYFKIYNAWTYMISNQDPDIINKFEKTYLVSKILNLSI